MDPYRSVCFRSSQSTSSTTKASASSSKRSRREEVSDVDDDSTRGAEEIVEEPKPVPETVGIPKVVVKSKDADFQTTKGAAFTDLDEEAVGLKDR